MTTYRASLATPMGSSVPGDIPLLSGLGDIVYTVDHSMNAPSSIAHSLSGQPVDQASTLVVWGHGWGHDRHAFDACVQALDSRAAHLVMDFPGFGQSPKPPDSWTTADYADAVAELIAPYRANPNFKTIVWVGHSFGGRVGVHLAARHSDLVDGLFLVAAAGLPERKSLAKRISIRVRVLVFKFMKLVAPLFGISLDTLRGKFGSADYRNAGAMRPIFLNTIRENLSQQARLIKCPVQLVYGSDDLQAPPDIGEKYQRLIPNAELFILPQQDHYSVLGSGRHIVLKKLLAFMEVLDQRQ